MIYTENIHVEKMGGVTGWSRLILMFCFSATQLSLRFTYDEGERSFFLFPSMHHGRDFCRTGSCVHLGSRPKPCVQYRKSHSFQFIYWCIMFEIIMGGYKELNTQICLFFGIHGGAQNDLGRHNLTRTHDDPRRGTVLNVRPRVRPGRCERV